MLFDKAREYSFRNAYRRPRKDVFDGEDILFETDASGNITKRYTHGPGIDEPLMVEIDNDLDGTFDESAYYHTDGLGSITILTDGAGTPVKT